MKINRSRRSKKPLLITIIALVLALGIGGLAWAATQNNQHDKKDDSSTKNEDKSTNSKDATKDESSADQSNDDETKITPQNTDQTPTPTPAPGQTRAQVGIVSTVNVSGGVVYIRGGLNAQSASGTCYAQLTGPQGSVIRKDTSLLQNASTTDCKTIQIPTSQLTKGTWSYTLNFESDQLEGASGAQSFTIN